jgi:hypothetical protein
MPYIKLENFSGIVPRTGDTQLAPNEATLARNVRVSSRELRSWRKPVSQYVSPVPNTQTIFKLYEESTGDFRWLTWDKDVNVVRSPVADDTDNRIYYTGDNGPKKTNWDLATGAGIGTAPFPNASLNLGVPAPAAAPTLSASGGSGSTETRAYVYTYVSTFGSVSEESQPSPAATVNCNETGATVVVSAFSAAPTSGYNITHRRIYRTVVGATTVSYQLVEEIPLSTTTYNDTKTVVQLGSLLQTQNWNPPPSDLKGIVSMPNGMLAGFRENEVWFAEPYHPHAWPDLYTLTVDSRIVGLGVYDTTLVVLTETNPVLITGGTPLALSQSKLPMFQPCASKRSIASDQYGVMYASPNGLVSIGAGGADVITLPLYTREEWQALVPSTMRSFIYNNQYFGFYSNPTGSRAIVLTRVDSPPLVEFDFDATAVFVDKVTADIYAVDALDNTIYQLDANPINRTFYEWKSKRFIVPAPMNFSAYKVRADYGEIQDVQAYNTQVTSIAAGNQLVWADLSGEVQGAFNEVVFNFFPLNSSALQDIPELADIRSINVLIYADDDLFFAGTTANFDPVRLPAGSKHSVWQVELSGNVPIQTFAMGSSIAELRNLIE